MSVLERKESTKEDKDIVFTINRALIKTLREEVKTLMVYYSKREAVDYAISALVAFFAGEIDRIRENFIPDHDKERFREEIKANVGTYFKKFDEQCDCSEHQKTSH